MTWRTSALLLVAGGVLTTALVAPTQVQAAPTAAAQAAPKSSAAKAVAASKKYWKKTHYCYGKTVRVDDGDTIDVKLTKGCFGWKKGKLVVVRNAGIQATEVKHPWAAAECWGAQARTFMRQQFPKNSKVRLTAYTKTKSDVKTAKGQTRYVMYAFSKKGGKWVDAQAKIVAAGLAFNKGEHIEQAHNVAYLKLTQQAIALKKGMWGNSSKCGVRTPGAKLQAWTGWKTNGQDSKTLANTEWFKVRNIGTVPVPLYKWKVRDGSHTFGGGKRPAFVINSRVTLQPGQTFTLLPGKGTNVPSKLLFYNNHPRLPFYPNAHAKALSDADAGRTKSTTDYGYTTVLLDPSGNFRAPSSYPCLYACSKPNLVVSNVTTRSVEQATITNVARTTAVLTGVVVQVSSARYEFPAGSTLGPGEQIVVHFNSDGQTSRSNIYFGYSRGRLTDAGGKIRLRTAAATTIHMKSWGNGGSYVF